jgi:DNA-directed RNA polymerase I, II, and III subunit RPABC2
MLHRREFRLSEEIRIGPPKLTRFERARIIGARSLQVSLGAPILVDLPDSVIDPIDIALAELEGDALPMTLRRALPDGSYQDIVLSYLLGSKAA